MKKYLLSAALSTVVLAGCQNEEIVNSGNGRQSELTVKVTKGVDSRLEMKNGKVIWSEGDQLFVYGGDACGTLTLVDGAESETATFSGFINGDKSEIRYAVFGHDKSSTPDNVTFTLGTVDADEFDAPMFGTFNSTNNSIVFGNLVGLVEVTISDLVEGEDEATISGAGIAGTLKLVDGKLTPGTAPGTITIEGVEDGESFYVPMFAPQEKTPVELTVSYNGASDVQTVILKAGALNVTDMPESYYYVANDEKLYSDNLGSEDNNVVDEDKGVLKNEDGEYVVSKNEGLEYVLDLDEEKIVINLASDLSVNVRPWQELAFGGPTTKTITINGDGNTLTFNQLNSDWNHVTTVNNAKLTINNAHITSSGHNDGPWNRHDINFACPVELVDVISDKAIALKNEGTLKNVVINDANTSDTYAIWIQPNGQTINVEGCTIDMLDCTDGRGIKIDNQYLTVEEDNGATLNVSGTTFKTEEKGAIVVKSNKGANITLSDINFTEVAEDQVCAVWVDGNLPATYDLVNVVGGDKRLEGAEYYSDAEGNICVSTAMGITDAINNFDRNLNIVFVKDIEGDAVAVQKPNVEVVIDGKNYKYDGVITINGKSARYETAAITIKNINFEAKSLSADAYVRLGYDNNTRYTNNVTVKDCNFTYVGTEEIVAVKSHTGGDWNLILDGCVVDGTMHSLTQLDNVEKGLEIKGCIVNSIRGASIGASGSLEMSGCNFDVKKYAVRFGSSGSLNTVEKLFTISNSTLKSACEEGDAVVMFRGNSVKAKLVLEKTELIGGAIYAGNTENTIIETK